MIENADNKQFEGLRDFMNEHPDNKDAGFTISNAKFNKWNKNKTVGG